eukprot:TRINITY_DN78611_c0_g1_i1.p1 TRINITY_DN78611_c0_g1~~TRINITY_DN78611_c0_g1_i1.p1  ORF type:complete len:333 (+),score=45.94 TRINITY_DN78611_c0_g1_i1:226-1224(+)
MLGSAPHKILIAPPDVTATPHLVRSLFRTRRIAPLFLFPSLRQPHKAFRFVLVVSLLNPTPSVRLLFHSTMRFSTVLVSLALICTFASATFVPSVHMRSFLRPFQSDAQSLTTSVRNGLTGDSCKKNEDCKDGRKCAPVNTITDIECGDRADANGCECRAENMKECVASSECEDGEVCVDSGNTSAQPFCYSKKAAEKDDDLNAVDGPTNPNASPVAQPSDSVCIAVHSLQHFSEKELIYGSHRVARVLCDSKQSCATHGHVVVYRGRAMMMHSYCQLTGCVERIMQVNSPRYVRALRVPSLTEDLQFTAFAARYRSVLEERVLSSAVRVGL